MIGRLIVEGIGVSDEGRDNHPDDNCRRKELQRERRRAQPMLSWSTMLDNRFQHIEIRVRRVQNERTHFTALNEREQRMGIEIAKRELGKPAFSQSPGGFAGIVPDPGGRLASRPRRTSIQNTNRWCAAVAASRCAEAYRKKLAKR